MRQGKNKNLISNTAGKLTLVGSKLHGKFGKQWFFFWSATRVLNVSIFCLRIYVLWSWFGNAACCWQQFLWCTLQTDMAVFLNPVWYWNLVLKIGIIFLDLILACIKSSLVGSPHAATDVSMTSLKCFSTTWMWHRKHRNSLLSSPSVVIVANISNLSPGCHSTVLPWNKST